MKYIILILLAFFYVPSTAQEKALIENLIIITTDGFRWQEVFNGMDSALANNKQYNEGKQESIFKKYWDDDATVRRKKLWPFFWGTIAERGQIFGNRKYDNNVNVANPYWFSYPGYSEIFTGYPDTLVNSNSYKSNPNTNVLAFLNRQPGFSGKIAAFGAWNAYERILNREVSGFPVVNAFDSFGGDNPNEREQLINEMLRDSYRIFGNEECFDVFTHYGAMESLKKNNLKVLYVAYGETDEFAHSGKYNSYLDAAHQFDKWMASLWDYLQNHPQYKNKTALFMTTDHGRGDAVTGSKWTSHGSEIAGADEIWFAVIAPGVKAKGEMKNKTQIYQKQFAQTFAELLGYQFTAEHPIGDSIKEIYR
ncbi:MAG: alkaline phosphatase family protein [Chitinophagaceae bacterium]|nr:alkaline phosphatase family protein [Chitinophagaceae bacterium]